MGHDHAHEDHHDAEHGADGEHDDHAHDFDPEPVRELGDDEPRTPSWMPILGAGIFLVVGTWFLMGSSDGDAATPEAAPRPTPAAAADDAVRPEVRRAPPGGVPTGAPAEGAAPRAPSRPPQTPEERKAFIEQLKKDGGRKGRDAGIGQRPAPAEAHGPGDGHGH